MRDRNLAGFLLVVLAYGGALMSGPDPSSLEQGMP